MKVVYFVLFLLFSTAVVAGPFDNLKNVVGSDEYTGYECVVGVKPDLVTDTECAQYRSYGHLCQITGSYDGGIPSFCAGFCLERSEIPEKCAKVDVRESSLTKEEFNKAHGITEKKGVCTKGKIITLKGKAMITRGIKTMPATESAALCPGDILSVYADSQVTFDLEDTGRLKVSEKTRFQIPKTEEEQVNEVSLFFGNMWLKLKDLLQGEKLEIKTPTAVIGVRG